MSPLARRTAAHLVLLTPLLAACVPMVTSNKAVVEDKEKYLNEKFDPSAARPAVLAAVKAVAPPAVRFKRLDASIVAVTDEQGKSETAQGKVVMLDAGDGLVKVAVEYSNNDIPYRLNEMLTYRNVVALRWLAAFHSSNQARPTYEAVAMPAFAPGLEQPAAGKEYIFKRLWGVVGEGYSRGDIELRCKPGATLQAATLSAELSGEAVELECEKRERDVLVGREKYVMPLDLGVAFMTELTTSKSKAVFSFSEVQVTR